MSSESRSRRTLLTGGNRGIGLATAQLLRQAGHAVVITNRSGEVVDNFATVQCDVTDTDSVDDAFGAAETILGGTIEVLVANAGVTTDSLLMSMSDEDFATVIDTNLAGAFRCVRRAMTGMVRGRYGRIVLVSSVVGLYGSPGQANYAASKAGLVGLARSVTREVGGRGITANVVAPGFVETDMTAQLTERTRSAYLTAIPAGRFASPEEVGAAVAYVASDSAAYISGAVIPVDGGLGMGH